jgi:lipopolysaccharide/colanic/teichoic acid biosynthesis glycosyltransferase
MSDTRAFGTTARPTFRPSVVRFFDPVGAPARSRWWDTRTKRAVDVLLGGALLVAVAPLLLVLCLLVKAVDPGPALFGHLRPGRDGRPIRVLKIRTMRTEAERILAEHFASDPAAQREWAERFKLSEDPRLIPRLGMLLRRSSLDELPQLWNVVRGDMTLVGPRPLPDYHLRALPADFVALRSSVRPGLTGLWQVTERSNGGVAALVEADRTQIIGASLGTDLLVLAATVPAVLLGRGAI